MAFKNVSDRNRILVALGIIVFVGFAVFASLIWSAGRSVSYFASHISDFDNMINTFISDISTNKLDDALKLTDGTIRIEQISNQNYRDFLATYIKQIPNEYTSINATTYINGTRLVVYRTHAQFKDNIKGQLKVIFVYKNGLWLIDTFELATPPDKLW